MPAVSATYYTDPASPWCWALEPAVRRLIVEFGDELRFGYVMGGLAREFGSREALAGEWLEAAQRSEMPVDPRLWLQSRPASSYPACLAVEAAGEQGDPALYLRRLREGFACRARKLDTTEALVEEARAVPGLDVERFRIDLASNAIVERLGGDLERAAEAGARAGVDGRAPLPSLEFAGEDDDVHGVYGYAPYERYQQAARAAGATPSDAPAPSVEAALARFGTLATAEVASVCRLPGPRAPAELWRLAADWSVRAQRVLNGELWQLA